MSKNKCGPEKSRPKSVVKNNKHKCSKTNVVQKNLVQKMLVQKNVGQKKFGPTKLLVQENFGSKYLCPKFCFQKTFSPKHFGVQLLSQQCYRPPVSKIKQNKAFGNYSAQLGLALLG